MRWLATLLLPLLIGAAPIPESVPAPATRAAPALLPSVAAIRPTGPGFVLAPGTPLVAGDARARDAAARLAELMEASGVRLGTVGATGGKRAAIRFVRAGGLPTEGYRLETGPTGATITASDDAGLLYGAVTLWQLATQNDQTHHVAGVSIADQPRFAWRGVMLDSARHFQSPAFIMRLIDAMMASKLNRLHWHLVDDQGWRLPVPGYPRLTDVSAWRRPAIATGAPALPRTGGFYTAGEIRRIVAYAAARGVTIVPEIEMPGHALAAIRAYPALGMGVPIPPGTESHWGVFPWLYNTDEPTFRFMEQVLDTTMALFPSRWVHVGGDEAVKDQWRASPKIQAQIRALGLKDEDALQGWFVARIGRYLAEHGRQMVGWDESLDGGVPANAMITSWRGIEGGVKAAKSGHDAIMSPSPTLYLNYRQGAGAEEPVGRGQLIALADVLAFDPMPAGLTAPEQRHIVGVQGNLWTEYVRTDDTAAWMMFPRALAVAEMAWAAPAKRTVAGFAPQLVPQSARLATLGMRGADSPFSVSAKLDIDRTGVTARLSAQSGLPIRYTTDGTAPGARSPAYTGPVSLTAGQRLRAATFLGEAVLAGGYDRVVTRADALTRTSRELGLCSDAVPLDLPDDYPATGPRAHFLMDIFNPCWRWDKAPVAGARSIALTVGQVPFNFQVGKDRDGIRFRTPATPAGEFEVREGGCDGAVIATLPLAPAVSRPGVTRLVAPLPRRTGARDLCFSYTARGVDPLWGIDRVELLP